MPERITVQDGVEYLRADIHAAEVEALRQRAEDAELVAWGFVNAARLGHGPYMKSEHQGTLVTLYDNECYDGRIERVVIMSQSVSFDGPIILTPAAREALRKAKEAGE
jgi:hypothetical protein